MQGELIQEGATNLTSNQAHFQLYSAIYQSRPDIHCIVHVKTPDVLAVDLLCFNKIIVNFVIVMCKSFHFISLICYIGFFFQILKTNTINYPN